jgi:signal transduction histidine kinase
MTSPVVRLIFNAPVNSNGTWPTTIRMTVPSGRTRTISTPDELRTHQIWRQFVANASHELKSPVAGLQGLAENHPSSGHDDPGAAERFSTRLVAEAERLGRLITYLLDLSRLEDPTSVASSSIDLSNVAREFLKRPSPRLAPRTST